MGMMLGLALSPVALSGGGSDLWAALRAQIASYGAASDTVMAVSPALTVGANGGGATLTGTAVDKADTNIAWLSTTRVAVAPTDSRFVSSACVWRTSGAQSGFGTGRRAVVEFDWYGTQFETRVIDAAAPPVWLYVDDKLSENNWLTLTGASTRWLKYDFTAVGAATWRNIRLEYGAGGMFGGLKLDVGGQIRSSTAPRRLRLSIYGDSFTDGTGATYYATGYPYYVGRMLGFKDVVASGGGGTGYVIANPSASGGAIPNLADRLIYDGISSSADIYIVAMGLNDAPGVATNCTSVLSTLKSTGKPVFAVLPWNPAAPTPRSGSVSTVANEIIAVCNALNIKYFDPNSVAYTKSDATHPDQAGHITLAEWLADEIKAHIRYT